MVWGNWFYSPVQVENLSNIKFIINNGDYLIALKEDGTVWIKGFFSDKPVQVTNLNNVKNIASGCSHTVFLKEDGTVWTWGGNGYGQLGNGTNDDSYDTPVQAINLHSIKYIASGCGHAAAIKEDGTVWTWGYNYYGQLGDNTRNNSNIPAQITNINNVMNIAAGREHTVVLKENGTVWAWGGYEYGQLGDGYNNKKSVKPVQISGLNNVKNIDAGYDYTLALLEEGTVWAWGSNGHEQLGNGGLYNTHEPVQINNLSEIKNISANYCHTLALKEDDTVWAWGTNSYGQLNLEDAYRVETPVQVTNVSKPF